MRRDGIDSVDAIRAGLTRRDVGAPYRKSTLDRFGRHGAFGSSSAILNNSSLADLPLRHLRVSENFVDHLVLEDRRPQLCQSASGFF